MGYRHLNINERESILKMRSEGKNLLEIAIYLGRSKGTISRELNRNMSSTHDYKPHLAQRYYSKRRAASKQPYRLEQNGRLRRRVCSKLEQYHSPEQIAGRLEIDYPDNAQMRVSPLTIYSWVKRDKVDGGVFYKFLRQGRRKRRKKHGSNDKRGRIPNKRSISERPEVVDKRNRFGDWEGDSVSGKGHGSFIATLVERASRYLLSGRMKDKSAQSMNETTRRLFRKIPKSKRQTMTVDNGKEFAQFKEMEKTVGLCCYFADPYSSYQRGTNENTNGLLRQFFPKGTDFKKVSDKELDKVVALINNRSRKCLKYRTPNEVLWSDEKSCASDFILSIKNR
ncbi:Transposase, IS30 family [Sedimentisphaera cyanobacteriorum]|uniref:Transposase, IS30 family n=1 Tax=Sedimentisphaera cyanobacteriorum TaxID=1940790 RepID=A0A1Q2HRY5_9BACT|nr:IS30 family transposase [Sedimentisphaera cyanobacteriorum]AQQ10219.1 Transposase, IS30 family [Sedimentisphaera cyanobacteriorum]